MNTQKIAQAIYVVNCHAKTATHPAKLYQLKHVALMKLIYEDQAKVIGLHRYSSRPTPRPRHFVLVKCVNYYFHIMPERRDFDVLGVVDGDPAYRNPKARMSLKTSRMILRSYLREKSASRIV
ncbi:MAG: hypothetical protein LKI80_17175 [Sporolactobacillus sp.]|jgi:hypothetical protein|nr:hypothetical protein [Sporolactobacillus sp.]